MLRRRGQSDERRRRMLVDDTSNEGCKKKSAARSRKVPGSGTRYADGTIERQLRIVDLVPQNAWIHPLLFFISLLGIAGLLGLHHWQQSRAATPLAIFDLQQRTSLAAWVAALGLLLVAVLALITFSLRRWRKSDYHTRYRVWLWIAVAAVFTSAAVTTSWPHAMARGLATLTEWSLPGGTTLFWLIPAGLCYSILAIRLLLEVRGCRLASVALWSAIGSYCFLVAFSFGVDLGLSESTAVLVTGGCQLGIVAVLFGGLLWYARQVLLDAQGLLQTRQKSKKSSARKLPQQNSGTSSQPGTSKSQEKRAPLQGPTDLDPDTPRRAAELVSESEFDAEDSSRETRRSKAQRKVRVRGAAESEYYEDEDKSSGRQRRKLSKAERKRMRKQKARERHAA